MGFRGGGSDFEIHIFCFLSSEDIVFLPWSFCVRSLIVPDADTAGRSSPRPSSGRACPGLLFTITGGVCTK